MLGPNITGAMEHQTGEKIITLGQNDGKSGALGAQFKTMQYAQSTGSGTYAYRLEFDASKSNRTYTNSGKVFPLSLHLNYIVKC